MIYRTRVSEWLLFNANFSARSWREQVNFQWDDHEVRFVLDQHAELDFFALAHWNNSLRVHMSLHSDTLFWFRANQSLLLNAACLLENQQIQILPSLVWPNRGSKPRSTALETNTLINTPPVRFNRTRVTYANQHTVDSAPLSSHVR